MSAAALDADFGSYAQCHRTFQRALGCSPRDYFDGNRSVIDSATDGESGSLARSRQRRDYSE